ncbi:MAG: RNA methyltransferase [Bacteroidales bacterium]|nr:RNA methyltransferase [Bacteroidales bacterium]
MLVNLLKDDFIEWDDFIHYLQSLLTHERVQRMKKVLSQRTNHIVVVLEDIYQGHNASAVLRTCDGYGIQYVYVIENKNVFSPNEEICLGADKWLTIAKFSEQNAIKEVYQNLKKHGYKIVATTLADDAIPLHQIEINQPIAIVFGTEKDGLSNQAIEMADVRTIIPMYGFTRSYNVSVSAAIALEILTQKMIKNGIRRGLPDSEQKKILVHWMLQNFSNPEEILRNYVERVKKYT